MRNIGTNHLELSNARSNRQGNLCQLAYLTASHRSRPRLARQCCTWYSAELRHHTAPSRLTRVVIGFNFEPRVHCPSIENRSQQICHACVQVIGLNVETRPPIASRSVVTDLSRLCSSSHQPHFLNSQAPTIAAATDHCWKGRRRRQLFISLMQQKNKCVPQ